MINYVMLVAALALSAVAAYYSIAGLAAIFAAAVIPIVVMGSILEVSKLVVASWLYRNWTELPKLLKSYFFISVVILMILTSMGIFGFLSKAHLDQTAPTGDIQAQVSLIDEKINIEKETINEARKTLAQLDKQVNETMSRTANDTTTKGIDRSVTIRKQQAKERKQLFSSIGSSQTEIAKLQQEKAPLAQQVRKVEAEVGPIKYIAALIYGDNPDQNVLEKAVRWVIIMIVSVFDPLAVLMLVGYNWSTKRKEDDETKEFFDRGKDIAKALDEAACDRWEKVWQPKSEAWPKYELDDEPLTNDQIEEIKNLNEAYANLKMEPLFEKSLDDDYDDPNQGFDFLKGDDYIATPPPPPEPGLGIKTIEQEVEELQKPMEYDSAGRRMTPNTRSAY
jgi:hypothetical protein